MFERVKVFDGDDVCVWCCFYVVCGVVSVEVCGFGCGVGGGRGGGSGIALPIPAALKSCVPCLHTLFETKLNYSVKLNRGQRFV